MTERGNQGVAEEAKLEIEYSQCCQDWRWRDKYVLDKLGAAGILFGLLGVALGTLPPGTHLIKLCLLLIGAFFAFILSISVAKDTYYRDGTEKLLRRLAVRLGISSSLQSLKDFDDVFLNSEKLQFPRKIKMKPEKSSLRIPGWLRDWLLNRGTFRWILAFYLVSLVIFVSLFVLILVNWIWQVNLPI